MKLRDLMQGIRVLETAADMEMDVCDVAYDSRKVQKGGVFVAISGFAADGNRLSPRHWKRALR